MSTGPAKNDVPAVHLPEPEHEVRLKRFIEAVRRRILELSPVSTGQSVH
jgi:hypothetical protein